MGKKANIVKTATARLKQLFERAEYRREFAVFFGALVMGVFLVSYVWSQPWAHRRTGRGLGIGIFPTIFIVGLMVFSIVCLIDTFRRAKSSIGQGAEAERTEDQSDIDVKWWPVLLLSVAAFTATWAIPRVDPVVLVAGLGVFILLFGGIRRWYLVVGTAVGLGLFIYIFFIRLAEIFFPTVWIP